MTKQFGTQGTIDNFPFKDLEETLHDNDGVEIEVKNGVLYIGVDDEVKLETAKEIARFYLSLWSKRQNIKLSVNFNHSWKVNIDGVKETTLVFNDSIKLVDRIQTTSTHEVHIQGKSRIVTQEMHDSVSFKNDLAMFIKANKHPVLKKAIQHFSEEVVDDNRPLYGVYKALEAITKHLDSNSGRKKLADLAGQPYSYVNDVMQTTQTVRHDSTNATRILDDAECQRRAKILIDVFSNSLS